MISNVKLIFAVIFFVGLVSVSSFLSYKVGIEEGIRRGEDLPVRMELKHFTIQEYNEHFNQCTATFRLSNMREIRLTLPNSKDNSIQFVKCSDVKVGQNIFQPKN